jgi:hypothetical protein
MTQHRTRNMASDTDFQFIMSTILSQKQDSPLFKALECQLERYSLPFKVGLYSIVHLFFIYLSYYSGLVDKKK